MKLLCCADLHNSFDLTHFETQTYSKEPDLIVTLGDISIQDLRIIKRTADNLGIPAIGICGNHDEPFALQSVDIDDLHGKVKTIDGVTFAGIGGSLRYKRSNYMFLTQQQSIDIAKQLPKTDVLITHDKPYMGWYVDTKAQYAKDPHAGLVGIAQYLRKNKPEYHLYGHLHQRMTEEKHGTTSIML